MRKKMLLLALSLAALAGSLTASVASGTQFCPRCTTYADGTQCCVSCTCNSSGPIACTNVYCTAEP